MPTILGIEEIHGVHSRATPCEEINDEGVGLVGDKEAKGVTFCIQRFREIKTFFTNYFIN